MGTKKFNLSGLLRDQDFFYKQIGQSYLLTQVYNFVRLFVETRRIDITEAVIFFLRS